MSIEILDNNFMVCSDCLMVIANGDYTGLDNYVDGDDRAEEIDAGLERATENGEHIVAGDSENDSDFSAMQCDCCRTRLAGSRHHCVLLSQ